MGRAFLQEWCQGTGHDDDRTLAAIQQVRTGVLTGFSLDIRPRSGSAAEHGATVLNSPGTVDAGYRGKIKVIHINHGRGNFVIERRDGISQALLNRLVPPVRVAAPELDETSRAAGGFGSTGTR